MLFLLAGCAAPCCPTTRRSRAIGGFLRAGCYHCLQEGLSLVEGRIDLPSRQRAFELALILAVRAKELGLPFESWRTRAGALATGLAGACGYIPAEREPSLAHVRSIAGGVPLLQYALGLCTSAELPSLETALALEPRFVDASYPLGRSLLGPLAKQDAEPVLARARGAVPESAAITTPRRCCSGIAATGAGRSTVSKLRCASYRRITTLASAG